MTPDNAQDTVTSSSPLTGFGVAWTIFWILFVTAGVQDYLHRGGTELWEPLLWEGCSFVIASAVVSVQWRLSQRQDALLIQPWRWFLHNSLIWLPLAAPGSIALIYLLRRTLYILLGKTYLHDTWDVIFRYEILKFSVFYLLFSAVIFGIRSHTVLSETRIRLERQRRLVQEAQLLQLTQQLAPHFLFNALNTIASTIHTDPELADNLLMRLATMLRAATDLARKPETPLDEEIRVLEGYAAIMRQRFAERVTLMFEIDPQSRNCRVPTLIMQPLLENAFRHGVESHREMTRIWVRTYRHDQHLCLEVENDTAELPAELLPGVGLSNLQQRLQTLYGDQASLKLAAREGGGVLARIELPCAS